MFLVIFNILGKFSFGQYWRFMACFALGVVELHMILHEDSGFSKVIFPSKLIFEKVLMMRSLVTMLFIGIGQIGPIMFPEDISNTKPVMSRLETLSALHFRETQTSFQQAFAPFRKEQAEELKRKMERLIIETRMLENEEYREAYGKTSVKLRQGKSSTSRK